MSNHASVEQSKADLWRERFAAIRASGKSVREWCKDAGIPESRYYYWQKALRKRDGFVAIKAVPPRTEMRITWPDGMAVCIPGQTPAAVVAEIVRCLRGSRSC